MKEFEQQSFQLHYQERQQAFEKLENQKMMNMLHAESEEIIRALRQYNDFVKEFYDKTKAQNEENAKRMESLEKSKKRLTITSIIVSVVGVIASVIVGIFF